MVVVVVMVAVAAQLPARQSGCHCLLQRAERSQQTFE
jgi:hypothetical protein